MLALVPLAALPEPLPSLGFPSQNQRAETLVYAATFALVLPLAARAGPWAAARLTRAGGRAAPGGLGGALAVVLLLVLLAVRPAQGEAAILAGAGAWWLVAGGALARAGRPWPALAGLGRRSRAAWAAAGILLLGFGLAVTDLSGLRPAGAVAGAAVAAGALVLAARPRPARRATRLAADALVVLGLVAVVPDLVVFRPEAAAAGDLSAALRTGITQFHQDFLLGPAGEVLAGTPMLLGASSQYGVASIYLVAGWGTLLPLGYGTLALLDAALTTTWFAAGYATLRLAGTPRALAALALALGVAAFVLPLPYPVGALPQDGPLRFGLPLALVLAAAAAERRPARARPAAVFALAVVALSAVWSFEAFGATVAVALALVAARAWLAPGRRRAVAGRAAVLFAGACVAGHLVLALGTLAAAGTLPDWGQYLDFLRAFFVEGLSDITYDVPRWSAGLALGAIHLASALGLAVMARRGAEDVVGRPAFVTLAGATAYGVVVLFYWVDRSQDHILMRVAFPAVLVAALWLGAVWRRAPRARTAAGLAVTALAALLVGAAWAPARPNAGHTPLARALPGGASVAGSLDRLLDPPALSPASREGERLVRRHMPGERRSLVVAAPAVATEVLLRLGRGDRLGLGDPIQASFVARRRAGDVRAAVAELAPGTRMLLDAKARRQLALLRANPAADPLANADRPVGAGTSSAGLLLRDLAALQRLALRLVDRRFALRRVGRGAGGFEVVELAAR